MGRGTVCTTTASAAAGAMVEEEGIDWRGTVIRVTLAAEAGTCPLGTVGEPAPELMEARAGNCVTTGVAVHILDGMIGGGLRHQHLVRPTQGPTEHEQGGNQHERPFHGHVLLPRLTERGSAVRL